MFLTWDKMQRFPLLVVLFLFLDLFRPVACQATTTGSVSSVGHGKIVNGTTSSDTVKPINAPMSSTTKTINAAISSNDTAKISIKTSTNGQFTSSVAISYTETTHTTTTSSRKKTLSTTSMSKRTTSLSKRTTSTTKKSSTLTTPTAYTWTKVGRYDNCPVSLYSSPTTTYATATASTLGAYATLFADQFSGTIPDMIEVSNASRPNELFSISTANASRITFFATNSSILIDDFGITIYDRNCTNGVRVTVPNFFNVLRDSSAMTQSQPGNNTSVQKPVTVTEVKIPSHALAVRSPARTRFAVSWQFVDRCGRPRSVHDQQASFTFACRCMTSQQGGYADWTPDYYGGEAHFVSPQIDPAYVDDKMNAMVNVLNNSVWGKLVEYTGSLCSVAKAFVAGARYQAAVLEFLLGLGITEVAVAIAEVLALTASVITVVSMSANALKPLLYNIQGYQYTLVVSTSDFGQFTIDSQTPPYHNVSSRQITLPTPDLENDFTNCGTCGTLCRDYKGCRKGACVRVNHCSRNNGSDHNPCVGSCDAAFDGGCYRGNECNQPGVGVRCLCRLSMTGEPVCVHDNVEDICIAPGPSGRIDHCLSDSDCHCGERCVPSACCEGKGVCASGGACSDATRKACKEWLPTVWSYEDYL